ncbi:patatin-like phospholipase family protein [bacterium SCSIO 12696]|nr:patatin-like phospholipase family protein [bacterium SCSIO 12696]
MSLEHHLYGEGPKHILALDGGGIRGIISLAFLEKVEKLLAEHYGTGNKFRLSDHFALIGGTSTGSIIATCLALGYSATELIELYRVLSKNIFAQKQWLVGGLLAPKFPSKHLVDLLERHLGETTLGSNKLHCGLGVIAKRLDTHSTWLFHNHPRGPFYSHGDYSHHDMEFTANKNLLLPKLIRASTAAPTYFEPELIDIAPGVEGVFVDGGVSPHNNPALMLFMLATIKGYGFRWPMGEDKLHVLSIGTGAISPIGGDVKKKTPAAKLAFNSMMSLMSDCDSLVQTMMQWLGHCPAPWLIDSEIGDLSQDQLHQPACTYSRLNVRLNRQWLSENLDYDIDDKTLQRISRIDQPGAVDLLLEIGRRSAENQVGIEGLIVESQSGQ